MNEKTRFVFQGWLELSSDEQNELAQAVRDYNAANPASRSATFSENHDIITKRINLGPLSGGCTCCGR